MHVTKLNVHLVGSIATLGTDMCPPSVPNLRPEDWPLEARTPPRNCIIIPAIRLPIQMRGLKIGES